MSIKGIFATTGCLLAFSLSFLGTLPVQAQTLFQNNNSTCQLEPVLCDSGTPCSADAQSVACKNVDASVDFDGNGFVDCVATSSVAGNTGDLIASVLLNVGVMGVDCSGGMGVQFNAAQDYSIDY